MKFYLIALMIIIACAVHAQTPYTGLFFSPDAQGLHTDNYFNLSPNSGATSSNNWNIYHKEGGSIFSAWYGAALPYVHVGASRTTNLFVNGNLGVGTSNPMGTLHLSKSANSYAVSTDLVMSQFNGYSKIAGLYTGTFKGAISFSTNNQTSGENDNNIIYYERMRLTSDGNLGIGTTTPSVQLEVVGSGGSNGLNVRNPGEVAGWGLTIRQKDDLSGHIVCSGRNLQIEPGWTNSLILGSTQMESNGGKTVFPGGYVGIGTTNPTQRLTVKGTVYSTEVKVDLAAGSGPDYVFEPTYTLPSLDSVQQYINLNKHLPEVPSAKEMEANGVNLGEMNMLLLKKVEELTLYLIDQDKKNNELTQQVKLLRQQMEEIKK